MPRRIKEDDRIEMIIRDLLKESDNRRCINCNSLGPQYVCMTLWTFVCKNCSTVHREFTHRVKSVSTAKFNDDEIMALQAGGNERAKQIYFKTWDPQHNFYPDSSNLQRLREFVNLVYVERRYAGYYNSNKLPRVKSDSRSNFSDWTSEKPIWGRRDDYLSRSAVERGSNSGRAECNIFEKSNSSGGRRLSLRDFLEERNPRNNQEMPRSRSHRNHSSRIEIIDDRFREDGNPKQYERNSVRESGSIMRSPGSLRNTSSLPIIRPINVDLRDEVPELRIADDQKTTEGSAGGQKEADSSGTNEKENEPTKPTSLIDFFDDKPEAEKMSSEINNANSHSTTQDSAANVPLSSVEALLFELSSPAATSASCTSLMLRSAMAPDQLNSTNSNDVETNKVPEMPNSSEALAITVISSDQPLYRDNSYPVMQDTQTHQLSFNSTLQSTSSVESFRDEQGNRSPASDDLRQMRSGQVVQDMHTYQPPFNTSFSTLQRVESFLNEQGNRSPATDDLRQMMSGPVVQVMQTHQPPFNTSFSTLQKAESLTNEQGNRAPASDDLRRTKSVPVVQSLETANPSPRARIEIPEDLFTSRYPSFIPSVGVWQQTNPPHGAGYNMQCHPPAMPIAAYPISQKSKNPFDIDDDRFQVQAATFPYMAPFRGDLPNIPASTVSEFQPSPYASALPSQAQNMSSYGMNLHLVPGAYMAQLSNNMLLTRQEGNDNFGRSEDAFASLNPIQRGSEPHSLPSASTSSSLSRSGNPFG